MGGLWTTMCFISAIIWIVQNTKGLPGHVWKIISMGKEDVHFCNVKCYHRIQKIPLFFICTVTALPAQPKMRLFWNHMILFLHELFTACCCLDMFSTAYMIQVITPSFCTIILFPQSCYSLISYHIQTFIMLHFRQNSFQGIWLKTLIIFQQVRFKSFESDGNHLIIYTSPSIISHTDLY